MPALTVLLDILNTHVARLISNRLLFYSIAFTVAATALVLALALIVFDGDEISVARWEAEEGILSDQLQVMGDESESGQTISYLEAKDSDGASASYLVYVPATGMYQLKARVRATDSEESSFTLRWNEGSERRWRLKPAEADWEWLAGPETRLSSGLNKLVLKHQEGDVEIDQLELRLRAELPPARPLWSEADVSLYVDPESGSDENDGSSDSPLRTLSKALELVKPGWHIRLRDGVYKEEAETKVAGLPDAPIVIEPDINHAPVLDGNSWRLNALRIWHSFYAVRGIEFRKFNEGVKLEGVTGVVLEHNYIHSMLKECVRLRYFATENVVRENVIHDCGLVGNGEGIYVGTAPEQREDNEGMPDASTGNIVRGNVIYNVTEGIDIKEDSSRNTVSLNYVHHASEEASGAINVRANRNFLFDNLVENNQGSGIRVGGDVASHPAHGEDYHYGINNVLRQNVARNNAAYGFKIQNTPQDMDGTNVGSGNLRGLFTAGS